MWKGDILLADTEELENMDASEIPARRLDAKEALMPNMVNIFILPIAEGTVKLSGRDRWLARSNFSRI